MCTEMSLSMSQSFRMGTGGLEHNLRITKGRGVRQCGLLERRSLNEDLIIFGDKHEPNYTQRIIHDTVKAEIGEKLAELNEKHIRGRHPGRVRSIDEWIADQEYTRNDKKRKIVREYIIQLGNKYDGCPYEIELDSKGNMLNTHGERIEPWDTRHTPAYRNGKITESESCKRIKKVYRDFLKRFIKQNPRARVISACIHADERGGCHMHINAIWISDTQKGVGVGLAETTAIRQQYLDRGIVCGDSQTNNAITRWQADMRELLRETAHDHGIEKKDMHNKEKHRSIAKFKDFKDEYCGVIGAKLEIIRKKFPEVYKFIKKETNDTKMLQTALDKKTDVHYNKR